MIDPALEHHLEACRQLLKYWQQFRMFLLACGDPARTFTPPEEAQFLRLKSEVAMIYDAFFSSLDTNSRESVAAAQAIMSIVQSCITLRQVQSLNAPERRKFEIEWHESYMLINQTVAILEEKQGELAVVTQSQHRNQEISKKIKTTMHSIQQSTGTMVIVVIVAVVLFIVAAFAMDLGEINGKMADSSLGKVHQYGQKVLRDIGFTNISYKKWDVFLASGKPRTAAGYDEQKDAGPGLEVKRMKETALNTIFKSSKPETIGTETFGFKSKSSPSMNYAVDVVLFKNTADAMQVCASKYGPNDGAMKDKLGISGSLENMSVWRNANAVYFLVNVGGGGATAIVDLVR